MNRKLTKDSLVKFQSQVLFHFHQSQNGKERASLLALAQALEHTLSVLQDQQDQSGQPAQKEQEGRQGKSPFVKDLDAAAASVLLKKGEINTIPPYTQVETLERLILKEACR